MNLQQLHYVVALAEAKSGKLQSPGSPKLDKG